jgi:hypothetical protein
MSVQANLPQRVSELIDSTTMSWDMQKLGEFFAPMDREVIINIPLSTRRQSDFWAWHFDKNGIFTVRSAYSMLVLRKNNMTACSNSIARRSSTKADEKEWTVLWHVHL